MSGTHMPLLPSTLSLRTKREPHTQGIKRQEQEYVALGALDIGMQVRVYDKGIRSCVGHDY